MNKKYELTQETININGRTLYRIKALRSFSRDVWKNDVGGYIESESNLSHAGSCWVYGKAAVYGTAIICDDALVYENILGFGKYNVCKTIRLNSGIWIKTIYSCNKIFLLSTTLQRLFLCDY